MKGILNVLIQKKKKKKDNEGTEISVSVELELFKVTQSPALGHIQHRKAGCFDWLCLQRLSLAQWCIRTNPLANPGQYPSVTIILVKSLVCVLNKNKLFSSWAW